MLSDFEIATGSVPGRRHIGSGNLLLGKNNQDANEFLASDRCLVAAVSDGCGSSAHSEVGAAIGSRLIVKAVYESVIEDGQLLTPSDREEIFLRLERARCQVLRQIDDIAVQMAGAGDRAGTSTGTGTDTGGGSEALAQVLQSYFLFTIVGVLILPAVTVVFSLGDGVFGLNDEIVEIGPFEGNAPPYLAYALMRSAYEVAMLRFKIQKIVPTGKLKSVLIGTDGVIGLIGAEKACLPGKSRPVGPLSQLWLLDRFFGEPGADLITAWLRQINSQVTKLSAQGQREGDGNVPLLKREHGLLDDDTTVVVVRRKTDGTFRRGVFPSKSWETET